MVGTIKYIANVSTSIYQRGTFDEFIKWLWQQKMVQLDIETNVTDWWDTRVLISLQFGSCGWKQERTQWFIQWSELTEDQKLQIKKYLEDPYRIKIAHNVTYEYVVLRFYDIILENVFDTMLAEQVLKGGEKDVDYSLAGISWKYLGIMLDKTEQTNFGDNIINDSKLLYGVSDVAYLDVIRNRQLQLAYQENLINVFGLEMEAVLAFGDITFNGMKLDKAKWIENIELAKPLVEEKTNKINSWLRKEPLYSFAVKKGYISPVDRCTINYKSHQQKAELLELIFPDLTGSSLAILEKYAQKYAMVLGPERRDLLYDMLVKDYTKFQEYLVKYHREYLVEYGYLIPADTVTINWNSPPQVLELFQVLIPKIIGTGEDERGKFSHRILTDYEEYGKAIGLVTDYGESWIDKYCGPDGYVRTHFNQVLTTGRVSSSNPNMQNIIVTEEVGTRYRNCFVAEPGWDFIDSDYTGQELALIAWICKDPIWLGAIERGEDIHSIVAALMFAKKWKEGTEPGCAFEAMKVNAEGKLVQAKQKCNCKKHKPLRYDSKAIDFGLAYGMSEIKLASDLNISVPEARNLLNAFFTLFPGIKSTLDFLGHFGVRNGYIQTIAPFNRKRWFPYWREYRDYVSVHIQGVKFIKKLGEIERASKNQPIQGTAADMVKVAMVNVRSYIRENGLRDKVKMVAQVHDQITTIAVHEFAEQWKVIFDGLMNDAAKLFMPTGILKAETLINPVWTK